MAREGQRRAGWILVGCIVLFFAWYMYAADYSYHAISGTYVFKQHGYTYTLKLHPDKTFDERVAIQGNWRDTKGTWRRIGEGGVTFEGDFLPPPGITKSTSGSVYAEANKSYTLRPSLDFSEESIRFYKRLF